MLTFQRLVKNCNKCRQTDLRFISAFKNLDFKRILTIKLFKPYNPELISGVYKRMGLYGTAFSENSSGDHEFSKNHWGAGQEN